MQGKAKGAVASQGQDRAVTAPSAVAPFRDASFEGAFSNFGTLNCVAELFPLLPAHGPDSATLADVSGLVSPRR